MEYCLLTAYAGILWLISQVLDPTIQTATRRTIIQTDLFLDCIYQYQLSGCFTVVMKKTEEIVTGPISHLWRFIVTRQAEVVITYSMFHEGLMQLADQWVMTTSLADYKAFL